MAKQTADSESNNVLAWDAARSKLESVIDANLSLRELAAAVGRPWRYRSRDRKVRDLLTMSWQELKEMWFVSERKPTALLEIIEAAITRGVVRVQPARKDKPRPPTQSSKSDTPAVLPDPQISDAWDQARTVLLSRSCVDLSLRDFANKAGFQWNYVRGEVSIRELLEKNWRSLLSMRGLGRKKSLKLLEIADAAAKSMEEVGSNGPAATFLPRNENPPIRATLTDLNVESHTPVKILFLSARAKALLRSKNLTDLGQLLDFLESTDPEQLCQQQGVGVATVRELFGLLNAFQEQQVHKLREMLPMKATGSGLCFAAAAARIIERQSQRNKDALFCYLGEGKKLREASQLSGRSMTYISLVASSFKQCLDESLTYFTAEKHKLWECWERCEQMDYILGGELDVAGKSIVTGALQSLFAASDEGKAILDHRMQLFADWWEDLGQSQEFYADGLRVASLLRQNGHPYLLMPFLDYLERCHNVDVNRTTGKVKSRTGSNPSGSLGCSTMNRSPTSIAVDVGRQHVNKDEILAKLAAGDLSTEEASKLLDGALQEKRKSLYCKVSQKGAISVYGLQRMPVTLYAQQWERLLDFGDEIRQFLQENESQLTRKGR